METAFAIPKRRTRLPMIVIPGLFALAATLYSLSVLCYVPEFALLNTTLPALTQNLLTVTTSWSLLLAIWTGMSLPLWTLWRRGSRASAPLSLFYTLIVMVIALFATVGYFMPRLSIVQ